VFVLICCLTNVCLIALLVPALAGERLINHVHVTIQTVFTRTVVTKISNKYIFVKNSEKFCYECMILLLLSSC